MGALGPLFMFFGISLAGTFGVCVAWHARIHDVSGFVVAVLVGVAAQIVIVAQVLSFFDGFTVAGMLIGQLVTTAVILMTAYRSGARIGKVSSLMGVGARDGSVVAKLRGNPLTASLVAIVAACLLVQLYLVVAIAPNTWDSMTYHLTRIAYWIQHQSIEQYPNATVRQAVFPVNGEVLQGWIMMLSGGDRFVQVVQWVAALGIAAFVIGAARDIGFSIRDGLFAAAAVLSIPVVVAEATSSQNDLIVSFFGAAAFLFLLRGIRDHDRRVLIVSAVALGLAVGTKTIGLLLLPAYGLFAILMVKREWRSLVFPVVACVLAFFAFGSFSYIQNMVQGVGLTGPESLDVLQVHSVDEVPANSVRIAWRAFASMPDLGFGSIETAIVELTKPVFGSAEYDDGQAHLKFLFDFDRRTNENLVGLGLVALLLFAGFVHALGRGVPRERRLYALAALITLISVVATIRFNVWVLRFVLISAVLAAPLVAYLARREGGRVVVAIVVFLSLIPMTLHNWNKPLLLVPGESFNRGRLAEMAREAPTEQTVIESVNARVSLHARLGFVGEEDSWEYPYFGPHLERTMIKLSPADLVPGVLERFQLDGLLIVGPAPHKQLSPKLPTIKVGAVHSLVLPGIKPQDVVSIAR